MGEKHRNTSSRIKIGTKKLRHIETDTQNKSKWAGHSDKGIYPERQGCKDTESIYTWGHPEIKTHKEAIKATNEGIGTVNQPQGNREWAQKEKDMDPDTRHKQRDRDTEVVSEVETKPGTEEDRKRNRCRETPCQTDP